MPVPPLAGAIPVHFDDTAALTLVRTLAELEDELRSFGRAVDEASGSARRDWRGPARSWFDDRAHALAADRRMAATLAEGEIADVRRAMAWAAAEQQRRNDDALLAREAEVARLLELADAGNPVRPA